MFMQSRVSVTPAIYDPCLVRIHFQFACYQLGF
jgi:hypothetical protein